MRKAITAILSAAFIGGGLFAVTSYMATPVTPSVEASGPQFIGDFPTATNPKFHSKPSPRPNGHFFGPNINPNSPSLNR